MRRFKWLSALALSLFIFSCGKSLPEFEGIDTQSWKNDRNGCGSKRLKMREAIQKEKNKLLALDELEIIQLLGKPDRNELFKRNQKFYYYFLEPSDQCPTHGLAPEKLTIRFNAMGLAKEVIVE
jgi:hypothetical protein